jgi:hypothetical protein
MSIPQISTTEEGIYMSNRQDVSIEVDNVQVIGKITHRSEADIVEKIISPYAELSTGLHIPYFSRPFHSFLTEYGDHTAETLLKYLYELGKYMEENEKFLKLQLAFHFRDENYSDRECLNRFFDSTFPCPVPLGTRTDIMRTLK